MLASCTFSLYRKDNYGNISDAIGKGPKKWDYSCIYSCVHLIQESLCLAVMIIPSVSSPVKKLKFVFQLPEYPIKDEMK